MTTRITQNLLATRARTNLANRLAAFHEAQNRLSSGKRMSRPSDDVAGMSRALRTRAALAAREQEALHAGDAERLINLADTKLRGVVTVLQRIRELTIQAANPNSPEDHAAIAAEMTELQDELLALANSESDGRRLFGGHNPGPAVTNIAGTWTYTGDAGQTQRRLSPESVVTVNVLADDVFGFSGGSDLFTMLDTLIADVTAGDSAGIDSGLSAIDGSIDNVLGGLGVLGAAGTRVHVAKADQVSDIMALQIELSEVEDVDLAEAAMEIQLQEVAYQAALQAASRSLQPSLVDFLR